MKKHLLITALLLVLSLLLLAGCGNVGAETGSVDTDTAGTGASETDT